jgi:hypothetical protein
MIRQILHCTRATAAVEAAIFTPIFLLFTFGITDLGAKMFAFMQMNAATQSGAIYALVNSIPGGICEAPAGKNYNAAGCLAGIKGAMNNASDASFCTTGVCTATIQACADGSPRCIKVEADYPYTPILPTTLYSWAGSVTVRATAIIRTI